MTWSLRGRRKHDVVWNLDLERAYAGEVELGGGGTVVASDGDGATYLVSIAMFLVTCRDLTPLTCRLRLIALHKPVNGGQDRRPQATMSRRVAACSWHSVDGIFV